MLAFGSEYPDWETDGAAWPHRDRSRFVAVGAMTWHVQIMGKDDAPVFLLLHGTGAASHSFRDLIPLLADRWRVIVPDLPGHGFTRGARGVDLTLPGMARALHRLLEAIGAKPVRAAGHSAGAAILLEMCLSGFITPDHVYGFNSALEPIQGNAFLSPVAKMLFLNPLTSRVVSLQARIGNVAGTLLKATGSRIDRAGQDCYAMLLRHPAHVSGAIGMMAGWDLAQLQKRFDAIKVPVTLIAAEDDPMVPARVSRHAASLIPKCSLEIVPGGGHLLHEVDAAAMARIVSAEAKNAT